jgi:hypothetical protein
MRVKKLGLKSLLLLEYLIKFEVLEPVQAAMFTQIWQSCTFDVCGTVILFDEYVKYDRENYSSNSNPNSKILQSERIIENFFVVSTSIHENYVPILNCLQRRRDNSYTKC